MSAIISLAATMVVLNSYRSSGRVRENGTHITWNPPRDTYIHECGREYNKKELQGSSVHCGRCNSNFVNPWAPGPSWMSRLTGSTTSQNYTVIETKEE